MRSPSRYHFLSFGPAATASVSQQRLRIRLEQCQTVGLSQVPFMKSVSSSKNPRHRVSRAARAPESDQWRFAATAEMLPCENAQGLILAHAGSSKSILAVAASHGQGLRQLCTTTVHNNKHNKAVIPTLGRPSRTTVAPTISISSADSWTSSPAAHRQQWKALLMRLAAYCNIRARAHERQLHKPVEGPCSSSLTPVFGMLGVCSASKLHEPRVTV